MMIHSVDFFYKAILKTSPERVIDILSQKKHAYDFFILPKKNGLRKISALQKSHPLYKLQDNLKNNFLNHLPFPNSTKGYVSGESYRSFLAAHTGNEFFLRIDLKNFFGSIKKKHIEEALQPYIILYNAQQKEHIIHTIAALTTLQGSLPQGALTSPGISNLVFTRLDQRILKYCQIFNVEYTRYADDLLFSSRTLNFSEKPWFLKKIRFILASKSFALNYTKRKQGTGFLSLNGFIISNQGIRLSRKRFSDITHILSRLASVLDTYTGRCCSSDDASKRIFLDIINQSNLQYLDLNTRPFQTISQLIQYLSGYRSFLISWLDPYASDTANQKRIRQTICKIETIILKIEDIF